MSNVMTSARIQPFCGKNNIIIGCYDAFRVCPRNFTLRNTRLKRHENHFCLFWKSVAISFDKAIKELKYNLKVVDNVISDKHIKKFINFEYEPRSSISIN